MSWEEIFRKGEWLDVEYTHPEIDKVGGFFEKNKVQLVLDLGSGAGRHLIHLSRRGFDVHGCDIAPTGLCHTLTMLKKESRKANLVLCDMSNLPYDSNCFDAVISIQVVHHNKIEVIKKTLDEIKRVLRAEGFVWITVPISKNEPSRMQKEIEPGTYLPLDGPEKGLPHHYFKAEEIPNLFSGFSILDFHADSTNHFSILARVPQTY